MIIYTDGKYNITVTSKKFGVRVALEDMNGKTIRVPSEDIGQYVLIHNVRKLSWWQRLIRTKQEQIHDYRQEILHAAFHVYGMRIAADVGYGAWTDVYPETDAMLELMFDKGE